MKIHYIYLDGYKNLDHIEIDMPDDSPVMGLIGNNGSGKSNVLEALTQVFATAYNNESVAFTYQILYSIGDDHYELSNRNGEKFEKNGNKIAKNKRPFCLPRNIFLYYCGETERLNQMALSCVDKTFKRSLKENGKVVTKYLSSVGLREFPAALLANAIYENTTFNKVCGLIGIEALKGPVVFYLHRPVWSKKAPITEDSFWNAQGSIAALLHDIKDCGTMSIVNKDQATIQVENISDLKLDSENPFDLFTRFELLIQADILANIQFQAVKNEKLIPLDYLSEGEKQLAQLLCLLEATKEYRALFLLDEFDSFLHPSWQRKFAEIISEIHITGQVLFTTHSPLTLGKMQKENIRILKDGDVFEPSVDTYNRDITEVLEELMEVKKRPDDVDAAIKQFRNAAVHGDKDNAIRYRQNLSELLSEDDPFWVTVEHLMARLER